MKKVLGLIGMIAALLLVYMLAPKKDAAQLRAERLEPSFVAAEGKVETLPGYEVQVGAELTGRVERVYVKEGDKVVKGQVIARLESKDILAKLNEADAQQIVEKARLQEVSAGARTEEIEQAAAAYRAAAAEMDLATTNLDRYRKLNAEGIIPAAALEERKREFEVATNRMREASERKALLEKGPRPETIASQQSNIDRAAASKQYLERLLDKTVVTAPISGTVIQKNLHDGEVVYTESPLPLVVIADTEKVRINAEVDETDIGRIHVGDSVRIRSDAYPGETFSGKILEIADYVGSRQVVPNDSARNLDVKVVKVKISLPPGSPLKLGMTVEVLIKPQED
jgi:ABC exporter DevB family membrane fusion protein